MRGRAFRRGEKAALMLPPLNTTAGPSGAPSGTSAVQPGSLELDDAALQLSIRAIAASVPAARSSCDSVGRLMSPPSSTSSVGSAQPL
jgi:hypothetical protein